MNIRVTGVATFALAMALTTGCSSSSAAPPPPGGPPPASPSVTPSATPSDPSGDPSGKALGSESSRMPDVVGRRLSQAEATLTAAGLMSVNAVDASGQGRRILEKDNWVVDRQSPEAGAAIGHGVVVTLAVGKPTDDQREIKSEKGVIPYVVCHDLQEAQDAMRGSGFYVVVAKDGLGRHRYPLVDRNWIVVGQSAPPGSAPEKSTVIELTVVKFGEPTGSSGCKS